MAVIKAVQPQSQMLPAVLAAVPTDIRGGRPRVLRDPGMPHQGAYLLLDRS